MATRVIETGMPPRFMPVHEFQAVSGLGRNDVYNGVARGNIPAVRLRRKILIEVQPALDWIASLPSAAKSAAS